MNSVGNSLSEKCIAILWDRSGQTKDHKIGICHLFDEHPVLRSKTKDRSVQNHLGILGLHMIFSIVFSLILTGEECGKYDIWSRVIFLELFYFSNFLLNLYLQMKTHSRFKYCKFNNFSWCCFITLVVKRHTFKQRFHLASFMLKTLQSRRAC
jgi:hypothetical protein